MSLSLLPRAVRSRVRSLLAVGLLIGAATGGAWAAAPKKSPANPPLNKTDSQQAAPRGQQRVAQKGPDQGEPAGDHPFAQHAKAPSLEGGDWINTAGPIDLKQLRGKFVLLDFWTYCCINCMHILPELKKLEHAYPNEIVVIGVHSAKFATEQDTANIKEAVLRYEIEHPVVNDSQHKIWDRYEVQSWPTLCVIDPEGNLVARNSGEIDFDSLDKFFKKVMPYYRRKKLLDLKPVRFELAAYSAADTPLRFPGKILADEKSQRLFIADSNHNRIVVTKLDGTLLDTIGNGEIGAADGKFDRATFNHPQGMALAGDLLYVADTENHLLRKADLKKRDVHTLAGTGKQARGYLGMDEFQDGLGARTAKHKFAGPAIKTPLNSPWALWIEGRDLYVAMAGPHQIWKMPLPKGNEIGLFAGNGREDIVDGPLLSGQPYEIGYASFAQPSGLASDGKVLYVADSEGSSIRAVPFDPNGEVKTVVGTSGLPAGRLFTFGDVDGQGRSVRLQHALDVLYHDRLLYVADTYNNKIKALDPVQAICRTIAGTGQAGKEDEPATFDEPAGLAYAAGKLYVADTNNHAIRTIDLDHDNKVATLEIQGLAPPKREQKDSKPNFAGAQHLKVDSATLKPVDGKIRLQVDLELPAGYKINELAPLRYYVESTDSSGLVSPEFLGKPITVEKKSPRFEIELPVNAASGKETLKISLPFYYCQEGSEGVCKADAVVWTLPVVVSPDMGETSAKLSCRVTVHGLFAN